LKLSLKKSLIYQEPLEVSRDLDQQIVKRKLLSQGSPTLEICCPGEVDYLTSLSWQHQRLERLCQDATQADGLLLLTHPSVYTLGQGADAKGLCFDPKKSSHLVYRVERGGEVTYHGPGQWVGYPILQLHRHQPDLHWYLRQLEEVILSVLSDLGLPGSRIPGLTGVWIEGTKVAAIGIRARRWVTFHGFSLNVCPDLAAFAEIIPCGIRDRPVGSLVQWIPNLEMQEVGELLIKHFCRHFQVKPQFLELGEWLHGKLD
jgi:lipoyl(octanoyl) transferase